MNEGLKTDVIESLKTMIDTILISKNKKNDYHQRIANEIKEMEEIKCDKKKK